MRFQTSCVLEIYEFEFSCTLEIPIASVLKLESQHEIQYGADRLNPGLCLATGVVFYWPCCICCSI
jgi:hypothetical protein